MGLRGVGVLRVVGVLVLGFMVILGRSRMVGFTLSTFTGFKEGWSSVWGS